MLSSQAQNAKIQVVGEHVVCTLIQYVAYGNTNIVVINWLDLYTVESSALHG